MKHLWGKDPDKWVIEKYEGEWFVYPPAEMHQPHTAPHLTGEDAFAYFRVRTWGLCPPVKVQCADIEYATDWADWLGE